MLVVVEAAAVIDQVESGAYVGSMRDRGGQLNSGAEQRNLEANSDPSLF